MSASFEVVPGTIDTFKVLAGGLVPVGFIRLSRGKQMRWVARGLGPTRSAATVREFTDKSAAVAWLIKCEPDPKPPRVRALLKQNKKD